MISLSVIVPCHDQKDKIRALLDSLEKQSLDREAFEVVVSDDGSGDGSAEFIRGYSGPLNLKAVFSPEARGRSHARNLAVSSAAGRSVLFLDGDMIARPDLLQTHLDALLNSPGTVFLGRALPVESQARDTLARYRARSGMDRLKAGEEAPPRYFATKNASLARELLMKAFPFNESYRMWGGEDQEMGYRLAAAGARFAALPEAFCFHDHEETLLSYEAKMAAYAGENLPRLMKEFPEHALVPSLKRLASAGPARLFFVLFFSAPIRGVVRFLAPKLPSYFLAALGYDYLTYGIIFQSLRGPRHA
jgi:glycosyltransferase involved in cell wall biosynthesis